MRWVLRIEDESKKSSNSCCPLQHQFAERNAISPCSTILSFVIIIARAWGQHWKQAGRKSINVKQVSAVAACPRCVVAKEMNVKSLPQNNKAISCGNNPRLRVSLQFSAALHSLPYSHGSTHNPPVLLLFHSGYRKHIAMLGGCCVYPCLSLSLSYYDAKPHSRLCPCPAISRNYYNLCNHLLHWNPYSEKVPL